jgi:hypothetical protein
MVVVVQRTRRGLYTHFRSLYPFPPHTRPAPFVPSRSTYTYTSHLAHCPIHILPLRPTYIPPRRSSAHLEAVDSALPLRPRHTFARKRPTLARKRPAYNQQLRLTVQSPPFPHFDV